LPGQTSAGSYDVFVRKYDTSSDTTAPVLIVDSLAGSGGTDSGSPFSVVTNAGASITWHADENGMFTVRRGASGCSDGMVIVASAPYTTQTANVTTPIAAVDLGLGANMLRVCLVDAALNLGASEDVTVTLDTTVPTSAIAFPVAGASCRAATWTGSITGTAADGVGSGVASVAVQIRDATNSTFWDGSAWAAVAAFDTAGGTTSWS